MSIPDRTQVDQIVQEITQSLESAERSRALFVELQAALGLAQASQIWWAYFGAYDAADT